MRKMSRIPFVAALLREVGADRRRRSKIRNRLVAAAEQELRVAGEYIFLSSLVMS